MRAIDTLFDGHKFRSRLEARWAVLFRGLGVDYDYEPQGFVLGGEPYLPDFWLKSVQMWAEVKPNRLNERERRLCRLLAKDSGFPVLMLVEVPSWGAYDAYQADGTLCDYLLSDEYVASEGRFFVMPGGGETPSERTMRAYEAAKQARFEHGEKPGQSAVGVLPLEYDASGRLAYVPPKTAAEIEAEKAAAHRAVAIKRPWSGEQPMGILARIGHFGRASLGDDGRVIVDAPSEVLTDDFKAAVRRHKPELARLLTHFGGEWPTPELLGALEEAAG